MDSEDDIEERLELDYTIGEDIKEKLIPHAISWFTGEALQFEEVGDDDPEDGESEEDDDDEDDEDSREDEDEDESAEEVRWYNSSIDWASDADSLQDDGAKPKQEAAECKQS